MAIPLPVSPIHPVPSVVQRWYRRLYWSRHDIRYLPARPWRNTWLYVGHGGIGDELLCSAFAWEYRRRYARPVSLLARHPELFLGNPSVRHVLPASRGAVPAFQRWGVDIRVCEGAPDRDADRQTPPRRHIIAEILALAGISGPAELRPRFFLSESERARGALAERQVAIQSSGQAAAYPMPNKEWVEGRHAEVVKALRDRYVFVQVGSGQDPEIPGAIDLRGRTSLRELAAILARSRFFVGQVGLLMHLARAVDTRAAILYGGRERPEQSGYVCNENLATAVPCAPCWRRAQCDAGRRCMDEISVEHVIAALARLEERVGTPLETAIEPI